MKQSKPTDSQDIPQSPKFDSQFKYYNLFVPLVLAAAIGYSGYVYLTGPVLPFDDAFITYRYVENLLDGQGPVYNIGHRVMGYSSPMHLLLLALLKIMFFSTELPTLAVRFNLLPHALTGIAVYLLLKRFTANRWLALLGATLILVERNLLAWSLGGMESFIFAALMLFGLMAALDKKPLRLGVLTGLACLTRPEGVLLLPILLVILFPFRASLIRLIRVGASFALTILPWVLFAWLYYGSPVPLSVLAKAKPLYPLPPGVSLFQLVRSFQEWFLPGLPWLNTPYLLLLISGILLVSLIGTLIYRTSRRAGGWLACVLFLEFAVLYGLGNPMLFEWYYPVVFVSAAIAVMIGFGEGLRLSLILVFQIGAIVHRSFRRAGGSLAPLLLLEFTLLLTINKAMRFEWYVPVLLVSVVLEIMPDWVAWLHLQSKELPRIVPAALDRVCPIVFFAATLAWLAPATVQGYANGRTAAFIVKNDASRLRIEGYRIAAEGLSKYCTDSTRIAAPEIGSLGYYCRGYILDACGLVSPEALDFLPVPDDQRLNYLVGAISTDFVKHTDPDYVVTIRQFAKCSLLPAQPAESTWFTRSYDLIREVPLPKPCWNSTRVLIYRNKGLKITLPGGTGDLFKYDNGSFSGLDK